MCFSNPAGDVRAGALVRRTVPAGGTHFVVGLGPRLCRENILLGSGYSGALNYFLFAKDSGCQFQAGSYPGYCSLLILDWRRIASFVAVR